MAKSPRPEVGRRGPDPRVRKGQRGNSNFNIGRPAQGSLCSSSPGPRQSGFRGIAGSETRGTVWSPAQVAVGKLGPVFAQTNLVVKLSVLKFKS